MRIILFNLSYILYTIFPFVSTRFSTLTFKNALNFRRTSTVFDKNRQFRKNENMRITKKALIRIKNIRRLVSIIIKSGTKTYQSVICQITVQKIERQTFTSAPLSEIIGCCFSVLSFFQRLKPYINSIYFFFSFCRPLTNIVINIQRTIIYPL